jgi:hypothetical protein
LSNIKKQHILYLKFKTTLGARAGLHHYKHLAIKEKLTEISVSEQISEVRNEQSIEKDSAFPRRVSACA